MKKPNQTLAGKRILFLSPKFFGYEDKIIAKMEALGASVTYYNERSVQRALSRSLLKISPQIFYFRTKQYYEKIIRETQNTDFDYVFMVKADMVTSDILERLRNTFNHAKFCLYLWDSISNNKGVEAKFKYFDKVLSFDRHDSDVIPEIQFRPLFFIDDFNQAGRAVKTTFKYDISFLGTIHSDRYQVIRRVMELSQQKGWKTYFFCYLQSPFIYYFYKLTKPEFKGTSMTDFAFTKMESECISEVVNESKTVLDINHPKQTGLTIRTIEMIGMGKKLVTTNQSIRQYDFYDPTNILVIDRRAIEIPDDFIAKDYVPIAKNIYDKYSLEAWIKDILLGDTINL